MKVAICVPHYGDVKGGFTHSLARMLIKTDRWQLVANHYSLLVTQQ